MPSKTPNVSIPNSSPSYIQSTDAACCSVRQKEVLESDVGSRRNKKRLGTHESFAYSKRERVALDWMSGKHMAKIWFIWNSEQVYANLEEIETW